MNKEYTLPAYLDVPNNQNDNFILFLVKDVYHQITVVGKMDKSKALEFAFEQFKCSDKIKKLYKEKYDKMNLIERKNLEKNKMMNFGMETNKYYTPTIEEFHLGFDFEYFTKDYVIENNEKTYKHTWCKYKYNINEDLGNDFDTVKYCIETKQYRVKYLDKEDIESLKFEHNVNYTDLPELGFLKEPHITSAEPFIQYLLYYNPTTFILKVERIVNCGTGKEDYLFNGKIKNKSELVKLLKQLEI